MSSEEDGRGREWLWPPDDTDVEEQPADAGAGLASLGFISGAVRRNVRFWGATAVIGLLISSAMFLRSPPTYQATTTLLLTNGPEAAPGTAILDDQSIAQSRSVAAIALQKLGLQESLGTFMGSYAATVVTDRVLLITVTASSASDAVQRARVLGPVFLQYRAKQLESQQALEFKSLDDQVSQARQHVGSISRDISQTSAQPTSRAQQSRLRSLRAQRTQAINNLNVLASDINNGEAVTRSVTTSQVQGSKILDAAAAVSKSRHSRLKHLIVYGLIGFIAGLALGLGIVIIRALTSDRLRRRDDIAAALGAPVKLSVGQVRLSRWLPRRREITAARDTNVKRIVAHLDKVISANPRRSSALAVIPVDDPQVAALAVASLAVSWAQHGARVLVADLVTAAPAARLLGISKPGVHPVSFGDAHLVVALPDDDDIAPIGPIRRPPPPARRTGFTDAVADACESVDLLLTLAALDPAVGGEHLPTWSKDAVALITAGRSSWTRVHAVGEMARLCGTRLVSAVLVGADKSDESLGVTPTAGAGQDTVYIAEGPPTQTSIPSSRSTRVSVAGSTESQ